MKVICVDSERAMSAEAARLIAAHIRVKPNAVLGLATGSTPIGTYEELIRMHREEGLDFSEVRSVNLDEYVGLEPDHPQSYHYFMKHHLLDHIDIKPDHAHVPDGTARDLDAVCLEYDALIRELGGTDIQLLGIGRNGHIGFNEPGDAFVPETHVAELSDNTIEANQRFFRSADEVPRRAVTMGMGSIMQARHILLIACGESKADAVYGLVAGPVTPKVPASALQLHPHVTVIVDMAAARDLGLPGGLFGEA